MTRTSLTAFASSMRDPDPRGAHKAARLIGRRRTQLGCFWMPPTASQAPPSLAVVRLRNGTASEARRRSYQHLHQTIFVLTMVGATHDTLSRAYLCGYSLQTGRSVLRSYESSLGFGAFRAAHECPARFGGTHYARSASRDGRP
jgi:hypothetical protein